MEATTPAPAELEADEAATPDDVEEQGELVEDEDPADTSTAEPDHQIGLAEFTRSQQAFAELKRELGLDKKATREEVIAAARALREGVPAGEDDTDEEEADPRIAAAEQRAFEAELRVASAVYGQDFSQDAIGVIDTVRTTNDPMELMAAMHGLILKYGGQKAAAEFAADAEVTDETTDQPLDIGSSEGDRGPSAVTTTSAGGRPESGPVQAVREIFAKAIGAPRQ